MSECFSSFRAMRFIPTCAVAISAACLLASCQPPDRQRNPSDLFECVNLEDGESLLFQRGDASAALFGTTLNVKDADGFIRTLEATEWKCREEPKTATTTDPGSGSPQ